MAFNRRIIEGREGDPALPWWREVWRWANSLPVILGPGMTAVQLPGFGTEIKVRTAAPARVRFEVAVTGTRATVRPGMLETEMPWMRHRGKDWLRLDGGGTGQTPELDLSEARPGEDGRSCIALVAKLDEQHRLLDPEKDPSALEVVHRAEFDARAKRTAEEARAPFHELALLYWRNGRIDRAAQIVQHDLGLAHGPVRTGVEDAGVRYFFYAAG